jgi:DoxX
VARVIAIELEDSMTTNTVLPAGQTGAHNKKSFARHLPTAGRVLMGLLFLVFGLNGFLNFLPQPKTPMPEGAAALAEAMMKTGYLFPLIMGTQLIVGVLLLSNRFVPLALALIAPVVVNIFAFHAFLAPSGLPLAVVVLALEFYLASAYRTSFRPMLTPRATPGTS